MASVLGGFSGGLDGQKRLYKIPVTIPGGGNLLAARRFRIQIIDPPCKPGGTGRVSATIEGRFGRMEHMLIPQYEEYWNDLGIPPPTERTGVAPGVVTEAGFDLCGCIREVGGCDPSDEAAALTINPAVDGEGFMVTLTVIMNHLEVGTSVTGLIALDDQATPAPKEKPAPAEKERALE
jgi:hypothetical protein